MSMTTDERPAKASAVLAWHREADGFYDGVYRNYACTCGWWSTTDQERDWEAHRAQALAPLLDEFAAQDRAAAAEAVEAACRLAAPDHLTPMGERIILAAVRAEAHDAPATAPLSDAQPERGAAGHRDGTGAQKGGEDA